MGRPEITHLLLGHLILYFSLAFSTFATAYMALVLGRFTLLEEFFDSRCKNRGFLIILVTSDKVLCGMVQKLKTGMSHLHPSLSNSLVRTDNMTSGTTSSLGFPGSGLHTAPLCKERVSAKTMLCRSWLPFTCS